MKIADFEITESRTFIIAEIGNNHNGSFDRAVEMIDLAIDAGADCVKFQMRHMKSVYRKRSLAKTGDDLGTEYTIDLLDRFELTVEEHQKLSAYAKEKGVLYMCTPWDSDSVDVLEQMGVQAYKVASADLTNLPLIDRLSQTGKALILSTGMSSFEETKTTTQFLTSKKSQFALLHCNSTYPAPYHDINLNWLKELKKLHPHVGYSGHERGIGVSLAAVALGAMIIERHFTLDRNMEGPDHAASLEPSEFKALTDGIRQIEKALGTGKERVVSQGEMINRENLAKSLVARRSLSKGHVIKAEDIAVLSPGQGLSPQHYESLVGRTLQRDMAEEDYFHQSDLEETRTEARSYKFERPWGLPVRYHDFDEYLAKVTPDIVEFHLSYSDMDLNLDEYLGGQYAQGFVVHAPELFSQSLLMDLATDNDEIRERSLVETQRVVDITRDLKAFFPNTPKPLIVANIGGLSMDAPIPEKEHDSYYRRFAESLNSLDAEGVELIPQTMAPFPWHFGGQRYQNLFLHPEDIAKWCEALNLRMCFDISHSALRCNHLNESLYDFAEIVAPYTAHLHIGDAKGVNGEGLQVGHGDIDFKRIGDIFADKCPEASFIPEIWQGHKNGGEGFWVALEQLEGKL